MTQIGDLVIYQGRSFVLCGFDPISVSERRAELEDRASGERIRLPLAEVEEAWRRGLPGRPASALLR